MAGVLSLLALDERPDPVHPVLVRGVAGTLALIQAMSDAGVDAPLWLATQGAVSVGPMDSLRSAVQAQVWGSGARPVWSSRGGGAAWWTCPRPSTSRPSPGWHRRSPVPVARIRSRCGRRACWCGGWYGRRAALRPGAGHRRAPC